MQDVVKNGQDVPAATVEAARGPVPGPPATWAPAAALARAMRGVHGGLPLHAALELVCREAAGVADADVGAVYVSCQRAGELVLAAAHGLPPESIGERLDPDLGVAGAVLRTGLAAWGDAGQDQSEPSLPWPASGSRRHIGLPVCWDGQLSAVLAFGSRSPRGLPAQAAELLEPFAELTALACTSALAQASLSTAARSDPLTGLLNHGALHEALQERVRDCERSGGALALAIVDLDDFKLTNDERGHLAGDAVLRRVAAALRDAVRERDLVARYGGDEFMVVAVGADESEAARIARRALATLSDPQAGEPVAATAGVARWERWLPASELIARADGALLAAKRGSRRGGVALASAVGVQALASPDRATLQALPAGPRLWPEEDEQRARLRKRTRQLAMANRLGVRLAAATDRETVVEAAVDELHRAFGYFLCAVIRVRDDERVEIAAVRGDAFRRLDAQHWSQPVGEGVIGRCLRDERCVRVDDVTESPEYRPTPETLEVRSELCVPVRVDGALWGAINLEDVRRAAFDEDDARLLEAIADQLGAALHSTGRFEALRRRLQSS